MSDLQRRLFARASESVASGIGSVFLPNDIVMRTFYELYSLGVPIFLPRQDWVYRLQRIAPWGTMAYGVTSSSESTPWFNSINATVENVLVDVYTALGGEPGVWLVTETLEGSFSAASKVVFEK